MRYIGVWALGLLAGVASASEQDAKQWLERMSQSLQTRSYEGTFVYLNGHHLESMRIVRSVDTEGERERLISLNGTRREIVRDGRSVTNILPNARSVFARRLSQGASFPTVLGESYASLRSHYRFLLSESDRIAERETVRIQVVPRDGYRYGYRLWLDSETAIPLRGALVDDRGVPLEQVMFTQFRLLDAVELPGRPAKTPAPVEREALIDPGGSSDSLPDRWRFEGLPNGFLLRSQAEERMPGSHERVRHLVFSDGLVTVSAYIEKMDEGKGLRGPSRRGSISAFGKRESGYQVTVVGEVPPRTVERIANSIRAAAVD